MSINVHPIKAPYMHQLARNGAVHNRKIDYHQWSSPGYVGTITARVPRGDAIPSRGAKGGIAIGEPDSISNVEKLP